MTTELQLDAWDINKRSRTSALQPSSLLIRALHITAHRGDQAPALCTPLAFPSRDEEQQVETLEILLIREFTHLSNSSQAAEAESVVSELPLKREEWENYIERQKETKYFPKCPGFWGIQSLKYFSLILEAEKKRLLFPSASAASHLCTKKERLGKFCTSLPILWLKNLAASWHKDLHTLPLNGFLWFMEHLLLMAQTFKFIKIATTREISHFYSAYFFA